MLTVDICISTYLLLCNCFLVFHTFSLMLICTLECQIDSLYSYLFDQKCHPIHTLFGTIRLLDLDICDSLYSPIIMVNNSGAACGSL